MQRSPRALIVDDEPDIRELLVLTLGRMGLHVEAAATLNAAIERLGADSFAFCLTDMRLPDGSGQQLVEHVAKHQPQMPIAVITAYGSVDAAVQALKAGAFDFVAKPLDLKSLRQLVGQALKLAARDATDGAVQMIGDSPAMQNVRQLVARVARSQAPVFISGESGVGKELVARLIHASGSRAGGPFVPVNCGAIPTELMESEFFGHLKGSFTGAHADKQGLFQVAEGGTLFLDEVADLPLSMQVKLLRVIQEKAVRPVGDRREIAVDVRILSATHRALAQLVDSGDFRQDLYYRINVIELHVPALRERVEDIEALARFMLDRIAPDWGVRVPTLTDDALQALKRYEYPGNVRELENILERAMALCEGGQLSAADLNLSATGSNSAATLPSPTPPSPAPPSPAPLSPAPLSPTTPSPPPPSLSPLSPSPTTAAPIAAADAGPQASAGLLDGVENFEREAIMRALTATRWNKTKAAEKLGITFRALRYKLKKLGIDD